MFSEISTLPVFHGQLRHFLNGFVIFHTPPHAGGVWKIKKPFKKCLNWPRKTGKVTCIFLQNFGLKILKPYKTSKNHYGGPKNPEIVKKLFIFNFPFDETTEKHVFLPQKGPYLRETLLHSVYGSTVKILTLTFGPKFFRDFST